MYFNKKSMVECYVEACPWFWKEDDCMSMCLWNLISSALDLA